MRDVRYGLIKPKFDEGRIKRFEDIISVIPKSRLAEDIGKGLRGIDKVIAKPETFKVSELARIEKLCDLSLREMLTIVSVDYKMPKLKGNDERYKDIHSMFKAGNINSFEEIFAYIPRKIVAFDMKTKSDRLGRLINKVETFSIREIFLIGSLCYLSKEQTIALFLEAYESQNKYKKLKS
jgi:hypothetical protein